MSGATAQALVRTVDGVNTSGPARRPSNDGLGVQAPVAVELTDEVYERAVRTLAKIIAAWGDGQQPVATRR